MSLKLKSIRDQVIVITGASSGIGLTTAEMAAERGAAVVLSARSEDELKSVVDGIRQRGGRATYVVADVADEQAVQRVANRAIEEFGGFDTWVNNAGVSIYGRLTDVPIDDKRRVFETNFWGTLYGCKAAVAQLRRRGGAIINIGSVVSDFAVPLQGIYSASKHAVKGYTDALRMELEQEGAPISVTLVKPGPIDTPLPEHGRKYIAEQAKHQPPVYPPEEVAFAILRCAVKPTREIIVGGGSRVMSAFAAMAPRLTDKYMERAGFKGQKTDEPANSADNLYGPSHDNRRRGNYPGYVMRRSAYTRAALSTSAQAIAFVIVGAVIVASAFAARH